MVNDVINSSGEFIDRYICIFQGDGRSKLKPLALEELLLLSAENDHEPVVVFNGYVCSDTLNAEMLSKRLEPWQDDIPQLMLACDIFYPQFPNVKDDPYFDSTPILPSEQNLMDLFISYSKVQEVSSMDPTVFCASHIYPASLGQLLKAYIEKNNLILPQWFNLQIPDSTVWGMKLSKDTA